MKEIKIRKIELMGTFITHNALLNTDQENINNV